MIRSILLPVSEEPLPESVFAAAAWLARKRKGRVHALAVIDAKAFDIPVMGTPDGFMPAVVTPPVTDSQGLFEEMAARSKAALGRFERGCAAAGISCSTEVKSGIPGEVLANASVAHDLVVMGRKGYGRADPGGKRLDALIPQVIRGSIRPVMVVGTGFPPTPPETLNVVLAYDGSIHAGRALSVAVELAGPGGVCTLVTIAASEEAGVEILEPAESYLYHHDVVPQRQVVIGSRASDLICEVASKAGADILVMGAYGHTPVREMLFGSTTEKVLSHCGTSVVLQS